MTYINGFLLAVPTANKEAYVKMAADAGALFKEYGAIEIVEAWGTQVPDGKITDFRKAVQATPDEAVVFSWITWPDKATADAAEGKMLQDERMQPPAEMPFDGRRMIFGGFTPVYELGREGVGR